MTGSLPLPGDFSWAEPLNDFVTGVKSEADGTSTSLNGHVTSSDPHHVLPAAASAANSALASHAQGADTHGDRAWADGKFVPLNVVSNVDLAAPLVKWTLTSPSSTSLGFMEIWARGFRAVNVDGFGITNLGPTSVTSTPLKLYAVNGAITTTADLLSAFIAGDVATATVGITAAGNLRAKNVGQGAWTAVPVTNAGYTAEASGGTAYQPQMRLENPDKVVLRGRINVTAAMTANDVIGTLAAPWRPAKIVLLAMATLGTTSAPQFLTINPAGQVIVGRTVATAGSISLDGLSYQLTV